MSARTFFLGALALPLVLPLVGLMASFVSQAIAGTQEATAVSLAANFLLASLFIGGLPYLLFLAGSLLWLRRQRTRTVRRFTAVAPLLFAVVFVALWVPFALAAGGPADAAFLSAGYYALFCLGLGGAYAALVHVSYVVLRAWGKVGAVRAG